MDMERGKILTEAQLTSARKAFQTIDDKEAAKVEDDYPSLEEIRRIREERNKKFDEQKKK